MYTATLILLKCVYNMRSIAYKEDGARIIMVKNNVQLLMIRDVVWQTSKC